MAKFIGKLAGARALARVALDGRAWLDAYCAGRGEYRARLFEREEIPPMSEPEERTSAREEFCTCGDC